MSPDGRCRVFDKMLWFRAMKGRNGRTKPLSRLKPTAIDLRSESSTHAAERADERVDGAAGRRAVLRIACQRALARPGCICRGPQFRHPDRRYTELNVAASVLKEGCRHACDRFGQTSIAHLKRRDLALIKVTLMLRVGRLFLRCIIGRRTSRSVRWVSASYSVNNPGL